MLSFHDEDTIAAISTAMGDAGIGIVRLSGDEALTIAQKIFVSKSGKCLAQLKSHSMLYGHILDVSTGMKIDEVLVTVMLGPHTYTTQNIVEINCHGGSVVTKAVLMAVLQAGARMAAPGEFTKRAFLGGRIDLTQAEAVMDIISARSEKALAMTVNQLNGALSEKISTVDAGLVDLLSDLEANIDYPEYDIEEVSQERTMAVISEYRAILDDLLQTLKVNRVFQEGITTAIIGAPNAGKSSLLNCLTQSEKAIVTEIPGTTRDMIEDFVNIEGIPFKIIDTAGIRQTDDFVEMIGVERSLQMIDAAALILFIFDSAVEMTYEDLELLDSLKSKEVVYIKNKIDLSPHDQSLNKPEAIAVSLKTGFGLEQLKKAMVASALKESVQGDEREMTANLRQIGLIEKAKNALDAAALTIHAGMPLELVSIDLQTALSALRELTGREIGTDIIDSIFSKFCLGK